MGRMEVITRVERRRRYSDEERAAVLAQCDEPGATVVGVSRRLGISASLIHGWRKTRREAEEILESGRQQAERMVQRTEVARSAEARARQIVEAVMSVGQAQARAAGASITLRYPSFITLPTLNRSAFSRKKGRFSGNRILKRVRLICCWSASACAKSVLYVKSAVRFWVIPYFPSTPTSPRRTRLVRSCFALAIA